MDRDKRWDRTEAAYRAMTEGQGIRARSAEEAVLMGYDRARPMSSSGRLWSILMD